MKKTLTISAIAALAVLPMTAQATDLTEAQLAMGAAAENDATAVATAGYVKSAYNVLAPLINTKQDKLTSAQMTAIENLTDNNGAAGVAYDNTTSGIDTSSVQGAIDALDSRLDTLQGSGEGSVAYAVAAETSARESADTTLQTNITNEATARSNADTALSGRISDLETALGNTSAAGIAETYATKVGVTETISASTVSVPVVTTWGSATSTTITVNPVGASYTTGTSGNNDPEPEPEPEPEEPEEP